jgi:hypothetical protein
MDIQTSAVPYGRQLQAVQQPQEAMVSERSGSISLNALLESTDRSIRIIPNDGNNNREFNAIIEAGGAPSDPELVSLLRSKLGYADGAPFDTHSFQDVAALFDGPVVEIAYNGSDEVTEAGFCAIITKEGSRFFREFFIHEGELFQNIAQSREGGLSQEDIDILSVYIANPSEATGYDILSGILKYPRPIVLVSEGELGASFDAAPRGDSHLALGSLLCFLRGREISETFFDRQKAAADL